MKKILATLAITSVALLLPSDSHSKEETVIKENRKTDTFRKINAGSGIEVWFTQSDSSGITVEAGEDIIHRILTSVNGETLIISIKDGLKQSLLKNRTVKVHISAPVLEKLDISSGSDFFADNLKCDNQFRLDASSGADATINNLTAGSEIKISATSGSDCTIYNLKSPSCSLSASSASKIDAKIDTSGNLNITASSAAKINISGTSGDAKITASSAASVDIKKLSHKNIEISKSSAASVHR
jgi:hypothetical protein